MIHKFVIRHGLVSIICGAIEYSSFLILYKYFGAPLFETYIASFTFATLFGFIGHSFFTFKIGSLETHRAAKFIVQALTALALGYIIVKILLSYGIPAFVAKALQLFITFTFNILVGRYVSFKS